MTTTPQAALLSDDEINSIWSDGQPGSVLTPWGIAKIRAIEQAILTKLQATQEPVQAGELPARLLLPQGFLSDVLTAAGLVRHGKQCKALADRLGEAYSQIVFTETQPVQTSCQQAVELLPLPDDDKIEGRIYQDVREFVSNNVKGVIRELMQDYARAALSARKPLTEEQRTMFKNVTYMLDAYVECIKSSGEYEAWHYIPEIEATRDDLNSYVSDAHGIGLEVKP